MMVNLNKITCLVIYSKTYSLIKRQLMIKTMDLRKIVPKIKLQMIPPLRELPL